MKTYYFKTDNPKETLQIQIEFGTPLYIAYQDDDYLKEKYLSPKANSFWLITSCKAVEISPTLLCPKSNSFRKNITYCVPPLLYWHERIQANEYFKLWAIGSL